MPQLFLLIIITIFFSPSILAYVRDNHPELLASSSVVSFFVHEDSPGKEPQSIVKVSESFEESPLSNSQKNAVRDITDFVFDPSSSGIIATSRSGVLYYKNEESPWIPIQGSAALKKSGFSLASIDVQETDPPIFYVVGESGAKDSLFRFVGKDGAWKELYSIPGGDSIKGFFIDPLIKERVYVVLASGSFIKSEDGGNSWKKIGVIPGTIKSVFAGSGIRSPVFLALTKEGILFLSRNNGETFIPLAPPIDFAPSSSGKKNEQAKSIVFDPHRSGHFFLLATTKLYETIDEGKNFHEITLPFSDRLPVSSLAVSPKTKDTVYVALGNTLLKSTDGGFAWSMRTMPVSDIRDIQFNPRSEYPLFLRAAY